MSEVMEKKAVTKPHDVQLARELRAMDARMKQAGRSSEASVAFLQRAGILDRKGELAKHFRA